MQKKLLEFWKASFASLEESNFPTSSIAHEGKHDLRASVFKNASSDFYWSYFW